MVQWYTSMTWAWEGEKKQVYSWDSLPRHPNQLVGNSNERSFLQSLTKKWLEEYIWHQPLASTCTHIHTHESQHTHAYTERKRDREDSENNKHCLTIISHDIISVIISDSGLLNHSNIIFLSLNSESRPHQYVSINYFIFPPQSLSIIIVMMMYIWKYL